MLDRVARVHLQLQAERLRWSVVDVVDESFFLFVHVHAGVRVYWTGALRNVRLYLSVSLTHVDAFDGVACYPPIATERSPIVAVPGTTIVTALIIKGAHNLLLIEQ